MKITDCFAITKEKIILEKKNKNKFKSRRTDGFGSCLVNQMAAYAYCRIGGYEYVPSKFGKMEHASAEDVENLNSMIYIDWPFRDSSDNSDTSEVKVVAHFAPVLDHPRPSLYFKDSILSELRNMYNFEKEDGYDFVIHIRRGDVNPNMKHNGFSRWVDMKYYIFLTKSIKEKYPKSKILILSEGKLDDFSGIDADEIWLNKDIVETFHAMVSAKNLIISRSAFPYAAALLNTNTVYHVGEFWFATLDHWLSSDEFYPIAGYVFDSANAKRHERHHEWGTIADHFLFPP